MTFNCHISEKAQGPPLGAIRSMDPASISSRSSSRILWRYFSFPPKTWSRCFLGPPVFDGDFLLNISVSSRYGIFENIVEVGNLSFSRCGIWKLNFGGFLFGDLVNVLNWDTRGGDYIQVMSTMGNPWKMAWFVTRMGENEHESHHTDASKRLRLEFSFGHTIRYQSPSDDPSEVSLGSLS